VKDQKESAKKKELQKERKSEIEKGCIIAIIAKIFRL
jgi:hypothetical protein